MRDLFFLALLPVFLYFMARRPFVGLGMWIWTALFFPNAWMYGAAASIRYNLVFAGITILGYLVLRDKPKARLGAIGAGVLLFFFWTTISSTMTLNDPDITWEIWNRFFKVVLLFVFVVLIVEKKLHIDFFLWCIVLSVDFFASVEALKFIMSGGGHKIAGFTGHTLGDRNELALAFVISLPVCFYLLSEYGQRSRVLRIGLIGVMGLVVVAVIGTQSRGGMVALLGLAGYLFLKTDRKLSFIVLAALLTLFLSQFVSEEWRSRMDTIGEADQDSSFLGRVVAWKLSFIMATQHPFFGGGFKALEYFPNWSLLSQDWYNFSFFPTGEAVPDPNHGHAAHSVYFQVLGEHGFFGLAIYLWMLAQAFRTARRVAVKAREHLSTQWIAGLATMLQLSVFAFCLGGAALSFAYFDMMFGIYGLIQVLHARILPAALAALPVLPGDAKAPGSAASARHV